MIQRQFLAREQLRQIFLGNPGVEGGGFQKLVAAGARNIPSEIFYTFPNRPQVIAKTRM